VAGEGERFRKRARECRDLAAVTSDPEWRDKLNELAADLEAEAARADSEEEPPDSTRQ
jgi:hypothetical protein